MKTLFRSLNPLLRSILVITVLINCSTNDKVSPEEPAFTDLPFEAFLDYLQTVVTEEQQEVVNVYMDSMSITPKIEGTSVYFLHNANRQTVTVAGDFNDWNSEANSLTNVTGTNLWYTKFIFEPNARLEYKFITDGNWILDPTNPNRVSGGFGANSELAMPDYVQPWEIEDLGNPDGTMDSFDFTSTNTGATYKVDVYLPSGYDADGSYPSVYIHDGEGYITLGAARNVINNLIASGEIEALIAIFITPTDRSAEYAFAQRFNFSNFITDELVSHIDANYATITSAERRAVFGASFGGNISAIISYYNPDIFGNMGLHSGAFWPNDHEMTNTITTGPVKPIKVASIWGSYEQDIAYDMNIVKDFMLANSYEIYWKELPEGHSWGLWRATIDDILIFFFPL